MSYLGRIKGTANELIESISNALKVHVSNDVILSTAGAQKEIIVQRLDTVGDGSGSSNMAVDGSVTPVIFRIKPPAGEIWRIASWNIYVQDSGTFDASLWGNGITLANGIATSFFDGTSSISLLQHTIKSSGDVSAVATRIDYLTMGSGDTILTAHWDFILQGQYIRLVGDNNEELRVVISDDLTGLTAQYVQAMGYKE